MHIWPAIYNLSHLTSAYPSILYTDHKFSNEASPVQYRPKVIKICCQTFDFNISYVQYITYSNLYVKDKRKQMFA